MRSHSPSSSSALALSPPPTTEKPGQSATASATIRVPSAKRGSSNAPSGPFHSTVPAPATTVGEGGGRVGTDVEPRPAVGQVALDDLDAPPRPVALRRRPEGAAGLEGPGVGRQQDVDARVEQRPAVLEVRLVQQRAPDVLSLGGQEGEGHAAADDQRVHLGGQDLEHLELVGHLGPAHHGHEGAGRAAPGCRPAPRPPGRSAARPRWAGSAAARRWRRGRGGPRRRPRPRRRRSRRSGAARRPGRWPSRPGRSAGSRSARPRGRGPAAARAPGPSPSAGRVRRPAGPGARRPPPRPPRPAASAGSAARR